MTSSKAEPMAFSIDSSASVKIPSVAAPPARLISWPAGGEVVGHRVAAAAAVDPVRRVAAHDDVVEARADRVLDRRQRVGEDPVGRELGREVDEDGPRRGDVGHRVGAAAAVDPVDAVAAQDDVVKARADRVLNRRQGVGVDAVGRELGREVDEDGPR